LAFLIVLGAIVGFAQDSSQGSQSAGFATLERLDGKGSTTVVTRPVTYSVCPVGMRAQQGAGGDLLRAREGQPVEGPAQRIRLVLTPRRALQITGARIRVRGLSGKNRMALADATGQLAPDRTQTLNATFTPDEKGETFSDLVLAGFTSVQSIELQAITYSDGSTWKMESSNLCKVTPDQIMRVAAP